MKCELCGEVIMSLDALIHEKVMHTIGSSTVKLHHKSCYDRSILMEYAKKYKDTLMLHFLKNSKAEVAPQAEPEVAPQEGKYKVEKVYGESGKHTCRYCKCGITNKQSTWYFDKTDEYMHLECIEKAVMDNLKLDIRPTEPEESEVEVNLIEKKVYEIGKELSLQKDMEYIENTFKNLQFVMFGVLNRLAKEIKK